MRDLAIFEHDLHNFDNFYAKDDLLENGFQTLPPELHCLVAEEDAEVVPGEEEETFLETEDEAPSDVESFIDGPVDGEEEET